MFGDVTSANIVGYTSDETAGEDNYSQVIPQFTNVGDDTKIKLSDMTITPANNDSIQIFDLYGDVVTKLVYRTNKKVDGVVKVGWFLDNKTWIEDYEFDRGISIWFCSGEKLPFTIAGQVSKNKVDVTLPGEDNYAQTGNASPVAIKLSSLTFDPMVQNNDSLQFFDEIGDVVTKLVYRTNKKVDGQVKIGWFLDNKTWVDADEYEIPAGKAFWVCTSGAGKMTIPAPQL